jgi:hypothetical protein
MLLIKIVYFNFLYNKKEKYRFEIDPSSLYISDALHDLWEILLPKNKAEAGCDTERLNL